MRTRSIARKTLLAALVLCVISLPLMTSTRAMYSATPSSAPPTSISLTPYRIGGTSGTTITVNLTVTNVKLLFTLQAAVTFNHHNTKCTGIAEGPFLSDDFTYTTIFLKGKIFNNNGTMTYTGDGLEDSEPPANGTGTLLQFTFQMNGTGYTYSDLHIADMELINAYGSVIPVQTIDYYSAPNGDIVQIASNPEYSSYSTPKPPFAGINFPNFAFTTYDSDKGNMSFVIFCPAYKKANINYTGLFNVTMPSALMSGTWAVYMNGTQETNWTSTSVTTLNGSGTMIYMPFSYSQALNNVYILSTSAYPEFASTLSSEVLATVLVAATLAAALFTVKLRSRKRKG